MASKNTPRMRPYTGHPHTYLSDSDDDGFVAAHVAQAPDAAQHTGEMASVTTPEGTATSVPLRCAMHSG